MSKRIIIVYMSGFLIGAMLFASVKFFNSKFTVSNQEVWKRYSFYHKGNVLHWMIDGKYKQENWLKLQLDKKNPPTINQDPIELVKQYDRTVGIFTKDKFWILHCDSEPEQWYIDDFRYYNKGSWWNNE